MPSDGQKPEVAAQKAVDADRLLAGENPDTTFLDDAEHWVRVYAELVEFKEGLLASTRERASVMHPAARAEVESTDLTILAAEAGRLRHRYEFWLGRYEKLRVAER